MLEYSVNCKYDVNNNRNRDIKNSVTVKMALIITETVIFSVAYTVNIASIITETVI